MAEKEYIEREDVLELMRSISRDIEDVPENAFPHNYADGWQDGLETATDKAENLPAADVRPERRGKWEICSDGYYPYCSECGGEPKNGVMSDFCPNCGARMNGKDDDGNG